MGTHFIRIVDKAPTALERPEDWDDFEKSCKRNFRPRNGRDDGLSLWLWDEEIDVVAAFAASFRRKKDRICILKLPEELLEQFDRVPDQTPSSTFACIRELHYEIEPFDDEESWARAMQSRLMADPALFEKHNRTQISEKTRSQHERCRHKDGSLAYDIKFRQQWVDEILTH